MSTTKVNTSCPSIVPRFNPNLNRTDSSDSLTSLPDVPTTHTAINSLTLSSSKSSLISKLRTTKVILQAICFLTYCILRVILKPRDAQKIGRVSSKGTQGLVLDLFGIVGLEALRWVFFVVVAVVAVYFGVCNVF